MAITTTVDSLGQLLKVWRDSSGLTLKELAEAATKILPGQSSVSYGTLHRYEQDQFPDDGPNVFVLTAVAVACGRKVADYPPDIRDLIGVSGDLLGKSWYLWSRLVKAA